MPRHVVLLGIGHTNAHVVRMWRRCPPAGARLFCVSNYPVATYSGMFPGLLAGQYSAPEMQIPLEPLCQAAGAELILSPTTGLDRSRGEIQFADRTPLAFDLLSVGIGSVPALGDRCLGPENVPLKPMQSLLRRLEQRLDVTRRAGANRAQVIVVGGGLGGLEVSLCLPHCLQQILGDIPFELTLVHSGQRLAPGLSKRAGRLAEQELRRRDVRLVLNRKVRETGPDGVTLDQGRALIADVVLWATQAVAPPLLSRFELPVDERGFLLTDNRLLSIADERVFAVGDSGTIQGEDVPKAGVYAVRQGPILWRNIKRQLKGQSLVRFRPQHEFLKLLNTGDGRAIGDYHGWTFRGRWVWRLKDSVDRAFVRKYQR